MNDLANYSVLKGLVSELRVCVDLTEKGFEVFRAMSNHSCDLIALRHKKILRVEVKTVSDNRLYSLPAFDPMKCDILATVNSSNKVRYYPPLQN